VSARMDGGLPGRARAECFFCLGVHAISMAAVFSAIYLVLVAHQFFIVFSILNSSNDLVDICLIRIIRRGSADRSNRQAL
jgi:hypothetical protein